MGRANRSLPLGFTNKTLQDISQINSCERAYYYLGLFLGVHNVGGGSYARGDGGGGSHAGGGGDAGGQVRLAGEALDADPVPLRDILVLQRGIVALQTKKVVIQNFEPTCRLQSEGAGRSKDVWPEARSRF